MPHLSFRVLGPVEAVSDTAGPVDLGGLKQRAVLALLIVNAGRVVSLDRFVTELWDEYPPARATSSLQAYVSRLRRLLEPGREPRKPSRLLPTLPPGWLLAVPPEAVDAAAFTRLAAEGRRLLQDRQPVAAHQALDDALTLWRGPALAEFLPAPFARAEGTRLEELRLAAAEAGWKPSWISARRPRSWPRPKPCSPSTRTGNGCGRSSCWRFTGAAGRPTRWLPTSGHGTAWTLISVSIPGLSCNGCRS